MSDGRDERWNTLKGGIVANIVITVCATIIASYVNKDTLKKILSRRRQAA